MAQIRAYKLAEELKIEVDDFLEKASSLGIQLRNKMASLDEADAEKLRAAFGPKRVEQVEVVRSETSSGVVIRRRRKVVETPAAPPEPEPETVVSEPEATEPESAVAAPMSTAEGVAEEAAISSEEISSQIAPEAPSPVGEAQGEPAAGEAPATVPAARPSKPSSLFSHVSTPVVVVEDPLLQQPQSTRPRAVTAAGEPETRETAEAAPGREEAPMGRRAPEGPRPAARKLQRRQVLEGQNLKEQDTMARLARGNVQQTLEKRRLTVEQQARLQPRRRRVVQTGGSSQPSTVPPKQRIVRIGSSISLPDLATLTGRKKRELVRLARAIDPDIDYDTLLDAETAALVATEVGCEVQRIESEAERAAAAVEAPVQVNQENLEPRPPVVTVMGHVDHGKTSLLDAIRKTNVVKGEAGGITQHIGAYQVQRSGHCVTFIDTPGHAAFTQMRARGAKVTDIVILVVAADDGVMPQTVEAINHARAAGVPIIVAINKCDLPAADPQRVKQALLEHNLIAEDFGGDTLVVEVSAARGTNLDKLLETVLLQAEMLELVAEEKGLARGVVIEAQLDRGRGALATVLVQHGTLHVGDAVVIGSVWGRVRGMEDENGERLKSAPPSTPVRITGLSGVPDAGDELAAVKSDREAKQIVDHRLAESRRAAGTAAGAAAVSAESLFASLDDSEEKELRVVVKADVRGTMEAIVESLEKLSTDRVKVRVIHSGVGGITESDVILASASQGVIVGFHVRPEPAARKEAERLGVDIRTFDIVYELLDDAGKLMAGLLPPKLSEKIHGHAEVRQLFHVPRVGTVAGCAIQDGLIRRGSRARLLRNGVPVFTGKLASLKHFKEDVREVKAPNECGMSFEGFDDVKIGDLVESFEIEETPDTL